jgi:hypothetical protein
MQPEYEKYRDDFERLGPDSLRLRMEMRAGQFSGEVERAAEEWLKEQQEDAEELEASQFESIRRWTIIAAAAGVVAAIAAVAAALK